MNDLKNVSEKATMTCEEFQDRLPEMFETGNVVTTGGHLDTCEKCSSLVRDLQYIADQAKLLLPLHDPSPAVWEKIESKLHE
ncbi:MAG TPA: hypothetical protein VGD64_02670 [Acidisarcina sp.]